MYNRVNSESKVKTTDYSSPSWSHEQAHRNGKIEALEEIIKLIQISDKED